MFKHTAFPSSFAKTVLGWIPFQKIDEADSSWVYSESFAWSFADRFPLSKVEVTHGAV